MKAIKNKTKDINVNILSNTDEGVSYRTELLHAILTGSVVGDADIFDAAVKGGKVHFASFIGKQGVEKSADKLKCLWLKVLVAVPEDVSEGDDTIGSEMIEGLMSLIPTVNLPMPYFIQGRIGQTVAVHMVWPLLTEVDAKTSGRALLDAIYKLVSPLVPDIAIPYITDALPAQASTLRGQTDSLLSDEIITALSYTIPTTLTTKVATPASASTKPTHTAPSFDTIPQYLRDLPQWVLWEYRFKNGRWTKVPLQCNKGYAKTDNRNTWSTFDAVKNAYLSSGFDGIGFVFSDVDGLTGLDIDKVFNVVDGEVLWDETKKQYVEEILNTFKGKAYFEMSPSKTGYHIIINGSAVRSGKAGRVIDGVTASWLELYDYNSPRYFTFTGDICNDLSGASVDCQEELEWFNTTYMARPEKIKPVGDGASNNNLDIAHTSDKLLTVLNNPRNDSYYLFHYGMRVKKENSLTGEFKVVSCLWQTNIATSGTSLNVGDTFLAVDGVHVNKEVKLTDHSAVDLALCKSLAFFTNRNADQIQELFSQSGLMRDKWLRSDYSSATIDKAITSATEENAPVYMGGTVPLPVDAPTPVSRPESSQLTMATNANDELDETPITIERCKMFNYSKRRAETALTAFTSIDWQGSFDEGEWWWITLCAVTLTHKNSWEDHLAKELANKAIQATHLNMNPDISDTQLLIKAKEVSRFVDDYWDMMEIKKIAATSYADIVQYLPSPVTKVDNAVDYKYVEGFHESQPRLKILSEATELWVATLKNKHHSKDLWRADSVIGNNARALIDLYRSLVILQGWTDTNVKRACKVHLNKVLAEFDTTFEDGIFDACWDADTFVIAQAGTGWDAIEGSPTFQTLLDLVPHREPELKSLTDLDFTRFIADTKLKGLPLEEALGGRAYHETLNTEETANLQGVEWLIKDLLPRRGVGCIFGAPSCGKTYLAIDLAMAVARGTNWCGFKIPDALPVVFVALENEDAIHSRSRAYIIHNKLPDKVPNYYSCPTSIDLIGQYHELIRDFGYRKPALIIIDTLSKSSVGKDENSGVDMGKLIQAAEHISKKLDCLVLFIHHSGKDASQGMRGHSVMKGNFKSVISVRRDDNTKIRSFAVPKVKEGEEVDDITFALAPIVTGVDSDGDDIVSCAVDFTQNIGPSMPTGDNAILVWNKIKNVLPALQEDLIDVLKGFMVIPKSNKATNTTRVKRTMVSAALNELVTQGFIKRVEDAAGGTNPEIVRNEMDPTAGIFN